MTEPTGENEFFAINETRVAPLPIASQSVRASTSQAVLNLPKGQRKRGKRGSLKGSKSASLRSHSGFRDWKRTKGAKKTSPHCAEMSLKSESEGVRTSRRSRSALENGYVNLALGRRFSHATSDAALPRTFLNFCRGPATQLPATRIWHKSLGSRGDASRNFLLGFLSSIRRFAR